MYCESVFFLRDHGLVFSNPSIGLANHPILCSNLVWWQWESGLPFSLLVWCVYFALLLRAVRNYQSLHNTDREFISICKDSPGHCFKPSSINIGVDRRTENNRVHRLRWVRPQISSLPSPNPSIGTVKSRGWRHNDHRPFDEPSRNHWQTKAVVFDLFDLDKPYSQGIPSQSAIPVPAMKLTY